MAGFGQGSAVIGTVAEPETGPQLFPLVTDTSIFTEPEIPAMYLILRVPVPSVIVPLVTVQE